MKNKQLLFSVTRDDCEWQTFASGGPGGQHQNKTETGVRCIHRESGAVGESREHRSQMANRRAAFRRMAQTNEFKFWMKLESAKVLGKPSVDDIVDEQMQEKNLLIEVKESGKWKKECDCEE